jgi:large subunit ribosomal protein L10
MPTPAKAEAVEELATAFRDSSGAVLTEYRGLTVAQLAELRRSLAEDGRFAVVKNTLTRLAARQAGLEQLEPLLEGPSAVAFVTGDPVAVAKCLRDFARANPALVVKGGVLDGRPLRPEQLRQLADLQSREALLAQLAGALQASLARAAGLFAAPLAQAARLMAALQETKPAEPTPAEAETPAAADAPAEAETPAEAAAPAEADAAAEAAAPGEPETPGAQDGVSAGEPAGVAEQSETVEQTTAATEQPAAAVERAEAIPEDAAASDTTGTADPPTASEPSES